MTWDAKRKADSLALEDCPGGPGHRGGRRTGITQAECLTCVASALERARQGGVRAVLNKASEYVGYRAHGVQEYEAQTLLVDLLTTEFAPVEPREPASEPRARAPLCECRHREHTGMCLEEVGMRGDPPESCRCPVFRPLLAEEGALDGR